MIRVGTRGFALPTVLITSVAMMIILLASLSALSSISQALNNQYYQQLAQEASESGVARANDCLGKNGYIAQWSSGSPLYPNTTCSGGSPCTNSASCYVVYTPTVRTTFTVSVPSAQASSQTVSVTGTVQLLSATNGNVVQSYSSTTSAQVGAQILTQQLGLGYVGGGGVYFGIVGRDGIMRTVGYNGFGQLGNGTTADTLTPTAFNAPTNSPITAVRTSFLSVGYQMFVIDGLGNAYGAGANDGGQLGIGSVSSTVSTPTKFILPAGVKARFVGILGVATFVIGDDNNIYAAGKCDWGVLGSNYTISGCSNQSSYVRVNLPTPNINDLNTLPVPTSSGVPDDNLVVDRYNAFVRMQGGRVYGWGINDVASLGTGNNTSSSTPVKIGVFGDSGQPKATQLAYDGETLYILDDTGAVSAVGNGTYGSLAGAPAQIQNRTSGKCINNAYNSTSASQASLYDCIDAVSQQMTLNPNGTITTSPNSSTTLCLDNNGNGTADNNPVGWWPCVSGATNEQWTYWDDGHIYNVQSGKCLNNANSNLANDAPLGIWTCVTHNDQQWNLLQSRKVTKIPIPASSGAVQQIATDQWSVLFRTSSGEVWSAGGNDRGQLCNGTVGKNISPFLTKVTLPAGRKAVFIYTTKNGVQGADYANTYIIMDDGSVYGCGANTFGQLGNGTTSSSSGSLVKMNLPAGVSAKTVQTGYGTTIIWTTAGTVYSVGSNVNGQLGDGTTTNSSTPKVNQYLNVRPIIFY